MIEQLKTFLIERKTTLLIQQRGPTNRKVKDALDAQIRCIEAILIFLSNNKDREVVDMAELQLSLDKNTISIEDIKARQNKRAGESSVTRAVMELIKDIPEGQGKPINVPTVNKRTVASTVHRLVKTGILPKNISVMTAKSGKEIYIVKERATKD